MNANAHYPQASPVVRTQLDFKLDQVPRFWFGGDPYLTRMFDALSLTFPDGERYFIECVRLFRDQIADPALQQRVADFIRQEAQHGMAHDKMNQVMKAQGMPVDQFIARLNRIFRFELAPLCAVQYRHDGRRRAFNRADGGNLFRQPGYPAQRPPLRARLICMACH